MRESGENWTYSGAWLPQPTIAVIERPTESYEDHHQRRRREESAQRVAFGFARALEDGKA